MGETICMSCKHPLSSHYGAGGSKVAVCVQADEWGNPCGCTRER